MSASNTYAFNSCCDICGATPCVWPPFCQTCRNVDQALSRERPKSAPLPTPEQNLQAFATRARKEASEWRAGAARKADAVDRSYDFGLALGLGSEITTDELQSVLAAAFRESQ
jgi:hypothetical protein